MEEGNADHQKAVLIAICIFIGINGLIAIFGTIRTKALSHKTSEDVLTAHFLGGRSFGPIVLFGTMFASLFSGGTVVGKRCTHIIFCIHMICYVLLFEGISKWRYHKHVYICWNISAHNFIRDTI